jgi:hypothetical protein
VHNLSWDGSFDASSNVSVTPMQDNNHSYEFRVLVSNVSYIWEGAVGNSGPAVGNKVLKSLLPMQNVA